MASREVTNPISGKRSFVIIMPPEEESTLDELDQTLIEEDQRRTAEHILSGGHRNPKDFEIKPR